MIVMINGASHEVADGMTVAQAVRTLTTATTGVAVAVNDEVVTRSSWETTALSDRDRVEVLTAVQGG
ncbi:sulfur carrier protein ThiS [Nonomuraea angiospora]|uniref:Sulfur carrier protein n=3 Tax=Streptosporangiaceae TaxID=2004 RepID=A0A7W9G9G6_9ACTN|nr:MULTISPECIES: sulfur carrier protein ThiS [Nonomuraea]MBB5779673.1 sulfur carrier protein [Nonomuraea jabiensis]MBE1592706.1 sulfur carrier protein [Nonomuraea angiospora]MDX3102370.1 sulfur carrier protein ThiS [Nonomuraea angiospora]